MDFGEEFVVDVCVLVNVVCVDVGEICIDFLLYVYGV